MNVLGSNKGPPSSSSKDQALIKWSRQGHLQPGSSSNKASSRHLCRHKAMSKHLHHLGSTTSSISTWPHNCCCHQVQALSWLASMTIYSNNLPFCHWWQQLMLPLRACSHLNLSPPLASMAKGDINYSWPVNITVQPSTDLLMPLSQSAHDPSLIKLLPKF